MLLGSALKYHFLSLKDILCINIVNKIIDIDVPVVKCLIIVHLFRNLNALLPPHWFLFNDFSCLFILLFSDILFYLISSHFVFIFPMANGMGFLRK